MFKEDLDVFLREFGVPCLVTGRPDVPFLGIPEQPDVEVRVGGFNSKSTMYAVLVKTSIVNALEVKFGTALTVDSVAYTVRECEQLDDGAFSQINMSKV